MKNRYHSTIILCGGDINAAHLPIATSASNAMIPVNGKPVIGWILGDLAQKKAGHVVIVTQAGNHQLQQYVAWAFQQRLDVEFALLQHTGNIVGSLLAGLTKLGGATETTVILGDTYIAAPFPNEPNYVLVSDDFDDPRNWCLAQCDANGLVEQYFDKENTDRGGLVALTGLYGFQDAAHLANCCETALLEGAQELSQVLEKYGQRHPIRAVRASRWYDFGHITHFLKAKHELLQTRYFNEIRVEAVSGLLHKTSTKTEKLRDEYHWYLALPENLKVLTPRVLGFSENGQTATLVQEYYGYPNLAELYLYGNLDLEIWKAALQTLMRAHQLLKSHKGQLGPDDAICLYWEKTNERLDDLAAQDQMFRDLLARPRIELNGAVLDNLPLLLPGIRTACARLADTMEATAIHGDFCLSNILYDLNNQLVRLIDPRGSFGQKGIYGDPRYDMAKLRHSLSGGYDFMLADLFLLEQQGEAKFQVSIFGGERYAEIARLFDAALEESGYALPDIMLIEALLFLSMPPLHQGKPERQKMMYLQGIKMLNSLHINNP